MKKTYTLFILALSLFACKKNNDDPNESKTPNWEIVKNFPQDKSYANAKLTVYDGKVFVNTYETSNGTFTGSLFFQTTDDWHVNQLPNQGVMALKEYNGTLYGIRAKIVKRNIYPVFLNYEYSYTLFKWENNDYKDIATLEHSDSYGYEKTSISDFILWGFQNKLHLISSSGYLWTIENDQFGEKQELHSFSSGPMFGINDQEVAVTRTKTISKPADDGTTIVVTGLFFNGTTFTEGTEREFYSVYRHQTGETLGNMDATYQAMNGNLWGIGHQGNKLKNYDTEQVLGGISDGKSMVNHPIMRNKNKVYIPLVDTKLTCAGIAIFDGTTLKELPVILPEPLAPCPTIIDATEHNGKTYLLLQSRGQYAVVRNL